MAKKRTQDPNELAKSVIDDIIEETESENWNEEQPKKDPAAVALGRLGGQARAKSLSEERRKEIAESAAEARWSINENKKS